MIFEKLIILILSIYFFINFLIIFLLFLHLFYMVSKIPLKLIRKNVNTTNIVPSILKYEYFSKGNSINDIII
jgi:hypothetical protein